MGARTKTGSLGMVTRLILTVAGVVLMVGPPYAIAFLGLAARLQVTVIAGVLLICVALGFVLLYLALRERKSQIDGAGP